MAALLAACVSTSVIAGPDIVGAGSSFVAPLYSKWADTYSKVTDVRINYQSIGSSGGVRQIKSKTVIFGASDAPLTAEELKTDGLLQFPTVFGGIVVVVNLPGIKSGELKLTGSVLADIYEKKITQWNDPRITALNPGVPLPDRNITVVHRSDGSGTTAIFTEYLSKVSPTWKQNVGVATTVPWPIGIGGKGNEGVAAFVQRLQGSIGYVEYAYAVQNGLTYTQLQNAAGRYIQPNTTTFAAAAQGWTSINGTYTQPINQSGYNAWPITGATFVIVHKNAQRDATIQALKFFDWAYSNGSESAKQLHYIPMPQNVVDDVYKSWRDAGLWN